MSLRKKIFLFLGKRFYIKKVDEVYLLLDIKNRVDRHIDAFGKYEKPQIDFLFDKLKSAQCSCFIDIGSHWGHYSLLFASRGCFEQAEVHAFEPDLVNRNQLHANLFLNRLQDRIKVYDYALSNQDGELRFHHFDENNRGRSCIAENGEITVKTTRLDSLLKYKGETLGIKVDVEGHELDVISGMQETLMNNKCFVQVESFSEMLPDLLSAMSKLNYKKIATIDSDHFFSNENTD